MFSSDRFVCLSYNILRHNLKQWKRRDSCKEIFLVNPPLQPSDLLELYFAWDMDWELMEIDLALRELPNGAAVLPEEECTILAKAIDDWCERTGKKRNFYIRNT